MVLMRSQLGLFRSMKECEDIVDVRYVTRTLLRVGAYDGGYRSRGRSWNWTGRWDWMSLFLQF